MSIESRLVAAHATAVVNRVARRIIARLQCLKDCRLSGDDSVLDNTWDEICVQLQEEESVYWDAYDATARAFVHSEVATLADSEREAIWLQTPNGWRWLDEAVDDEYGRPIPAYSDDVTDYVVQEIYEGAGVWSNRRIRKFLER